MSMAGNEIENVGGILRHTRREKRVTIVELARRMGVSQSYIARLDQGEIEPTAEQVEVMQAFVEGKL